MWWYREKAELPTTKRDECCDCDGKERALLSCKLGRKRNGKGRIYLEIAEWFLRERIIDASAPLESDYTRALACRE
jgi:hypothetical protein